MQATTIRWSETVHRAIAEAAEREGTSFATYVRVAAVVRWGFEHGLEAALLSGNPELLRDTVRDCLRELEEALARIEREG